MELVVLKAIEDCIGVPLQRFFDIVVGTRYHVPPLPPPTKRGVTLFQDILAD